MGFIAVWILGIHVRFQQLVHFLPDRGQIGQWLQVTMRGASDCHMCGRCSGFRGAIRQARRSPSHEIIHVAGTTPKPWETVLITFGLMGIAVGAFHWSASPWLVAIKETAAEGLVEMGQTWPLEASAPWWLLTNYPERNDVLTLLDGTVLVAYVLAIAFACGLGGDDHARHCCAQPRPVGRGALPSPGADTYPGGRRRRLPRSLPPSANFVPTASTRPSSTACAPPSSRWHQSGRGPLCWQVSGLYTSATARRVLAVLAVSVAMSVVGSVWLLLF
jgi:hypothetical protein